MIFSRFFTPDHAKSDPKIRKSAIEKLSPDEPKSKKILHELAFNDESPDVILAALTKLNSFALWQKMSQIAKNDRVKKTAQNTVRNAVLSSEQLSLKERTEFLLESADSILVAQALEQGGELINDVDITIKLLERVGRQATVDAVFTKHANPSLQRAMIQHESDAQILQRWLKKAVNPEATEAIESKIKTIEEAKQKPQRISQAVTLILSKLLALSENADYEQVISLRNQLEQEYSANEADFCLLKERDRDAFIEKKSSIDKKLDSHTQRLKGDFEEERSRREVEELQSKFKREMSDAENTVTELFNNLESATLSQFETAQNQLHALAEAIETKASRLGRAFCEPLQVKVGQLTQKITRIPEWQRHTETMGTLLQALSEEASALLDSPDLIAEGLTQLNERFYATFDASSPLADAHLSKWKALQKELRNAKKAHTATVNSAASQLRKSLNITGSLISQGKYRAAMQRFSGFAEKWNDAADGAKQNVQRKYEDIAEQIERLEGWQSYLAAPRKPSLLEEANTLVNDAELSMPKRAEKIKLLRKQWQSLSTQIDVSEEDKQQNQAFDDALEKAFAPCRDYFSEQEQKRKAAVAHRESLIADLINLLADEEIDEQGLLVRSDSIQKAWHESDSIPQNEYKPLKAQFSELVRKVQTKLEPFFERNKQAKESLIKKAEILLVDEHSSDTTDRAKALQQDWKHLGSAGVRIDGKLWKHFRELNNKVFARAKESGLARKEALNADIELVKSAVEEFSNSAVDLDDETFSETLKDINTKLSGLPQSIVQSLKKRLSQAEKAKAEAQKMALRNLRAKEVKMLKDVLLELIKSESESAADTTDWELLPNRWKQALLNQASASTKDFEELLLTLEILLSVESPTEMSELRTQLQLKLLSESFNEAERPKPLDVIEQCLSIFSSEKADKALIERFMQCVELAYMNHVD